MSVLDSADDGTTPGGGAPEGTPSAGAPPTEAPLSEQSAHAHQAPTAAERIVALIEAILCSDYPTQLALGATFSAFGWRPLAADGTLSAGFVFALSVTDTVLLVGLMLLFLRAHGEQPRAVFLGARPAWAEVRVGLPMTLAVLGIAAIVLVIVQQLAPGLHTVPHNPMQDLIRTPLHVAMFVVLAVVAGGIREELQRAFLLHRFEGWLGGPTVGVLVTSAAFGAGHLVQGADAALAIGLIGAFWATVYLRRRSVIAPMVSHSCFNLLQIVQFLLFAT